MEEVDHVYTIGRQPASWQAISLGELHNHALAQIIADPLAHQQAIRLLTLDASKGIGVVRGSGLGHEQLDPGVLASTRQDLVHLAERFRFGLKKRHSRHGGNQLPEELHALGTDIVSRIATEARNIPAGPSKGSPNLLLQDRR